jgi:hypothetical protein
MNFSGPLTVTGGQVYSESSSALYTPGVEGLTRDGGRFRYVKAGVSALVSGQVLQGPAQVAAHQGLVVVASGTPPVFPAIGDIKVVVTNGATPVAVGAYVGGYAIISAGPGVGGRYQIVKHDAALGAAPLTLTLAGDDALVVALTTASRVSLQASPYVGVIQAPATTLTGAPVGVAVAALSGGSYGWAQVGGVGGVLVAGTPAVGAQVASPSGVAGSAAISAAGLSNIGTILVTGVAGQTQAVLLDLP